MEMLTLLINISVDEKMLKNGSVQLACSIKTKIYPSWLFFPLDEACHNADKKNYSSPFIAHFFQIIIEL